MDRLRKLWHSEQPYEPLGTDSVDGDAPDSPVRQAPVFSTVDYSIFVLLGIAMLWAWNMFLAAGPYFQHRFSGNDWLFNNFQAAEISVSTLTNLGSMLVLTRLQANASYPKRIISSLFVNMATFSLLAVSTSVFLNASASAYFGFLIVMIFSTSLATGLCQNGIFAYVSGFGQPSYTQAIMTGQAVAGVLPCIAQIVSVLSIQGDTPPPTPSDPGDELLPRPPPIRSSAALAYFVTATVVALTALFAFLFLLARRHNPQKTDAPNGPDSASENGAPRKAIPLLPLFRKLIWLATAVFITFCVTMFFPVFTQRIVSVQPPERQTALLQAPCFIPLAFLFWNVGDLLGRLLTAVPSLSLVLRPRLVFTLAVSRIAFVGLYHLCNIGGQGAIVESDFFYLVVVQFLFGLSNGYLGSTCMIGANEWIEPHEREAAGGLMSLCLVGGLCVGSLLSFLAAGS